MGITAHTSVALGGQYFRNGEEQNSIIHHHWSGVETSRIKNDKFLNRVRQAFTDYLVDAR